MARYFIWCSLKTQRARRDVFERCCFFLSHKKAFNEALFRVPLDFCLSQVSVHTQRAQGDFHPEP